ncbi:MAG: hypothetical protein CMJ58_03960 [Planctomycetaceae bacterium]|nr:hypothetical protein [Planctomycetaceae bacterium]
MMASMTHASVRLNSLCPGRLARSATRAVVAAVLLVTFGNVAAFAQQATPTDAAITVPREFRAAWIATVANIDWPSKPGLPAEQQQAELLELLDQCAELHLNAVIFQVRPAADALYASQLEPWSQYLTGEMGQSPGYDPLAFAVAEAHARGLELHAWFNPYRVRHADSKVTPSPNHASQAMPELVRTYGRYQWFDPGEPAAVDHFLAVVADVVGRYDVDGVHIDDYFYPYPINDDAGEHVPFPDDDSYARAVAGGETLSRDDWRRQNVDRLIELMYSRVKELRPLVKVGISPFGIWRPQHPPGVTGFDQYASLYADARKWYHEGWVDYFTPQLYWPIDSPQSYPKLLAWWADENTQRRHLWPGLFTSRVRTDPQAETSRTVWPAEEIIRQIELTRKQPGATGEVHFSMKALAADRDGVATKLREGLYAQQALVPVCDWLPDDTPPAPVIAVAPVKDDRRVVALRLTDDSSPWLWAVRQIHGEGVSFTIVPGSQSTCELIGPADEVAVTAVSRNGRESELVRVTVGD